MRCEECMEWLATCPCCDVSFCPTCQRTKDEIEEEDELED